MNDSGPGMFDGGLSFMRMWSDFATNMMQSMIGAASPAAAPWTSPEAARQTRSTMIETWAKAWDQFLRSPPFLEMMQQSLANSLQWRKQMNEVVAELQHQFQMAGSQDIDAVLRGQRRLQESLGRMAERLDALEDRLAAGRALEGEEIELNGDARHAAVARKHARRHKKKDKKKAAEPEA